MSHLYFSRKHFVELKGLNSYFIKQKNCHLLPPQPGILIIYSHWFQGRQIQAEMKLQILKPRCHIYAYLIENLRLFRCTVSLRPINNIYLSKPNCQKLKCALILTVNS